MAIIFLEEYLTGRIGIDKNYLLKGKNKNDANSKFTQLRSGSAGTEL